MQVFFARWPSGRTVKWRSLTGTEFNKFDQQLKYMCPADVYNSVYRAVVLTGPSLDGDPVFQAPAGLVEWVARSVIENNPFDGAYSNVNRALEIKRGELKSNYLTAAKAIIAGLFRYTFEEIDQWDAETFFERLAAAEFVSGRKLDPGDPTKGNKGKNKKPMSQPQEKAAERVAARDSDPDAPPRPKKQMTSAQQMVTDRVFKR